MTCRDPVAHFLGLVALPGIFQQARGSTHDGENVAVLPNQRHFRLLRAVQQFFELGHIRHIAFQFKIVILPEMDIQLAVLNLDFALLKALAPAIAVLAGNVIAEDGLLIIEQRFFQLHGQTAAELVAMHLDGRDGRDYLAANRIVLVIILHEVAAKVAGIIFDGIADGCLIFQQFMPVLRVALVLVVELVLIVRFIWEKVRSQRRIKFHLQIMSPLSAAQVVVDLRGIVVFYRQRRIVERRQ